MIWPGWQSCPGSSVAEHSSREQSVVSLKFWPCVGDSAQLAEAALVRSSVAEHSSREQSVRSLKF